ncbi:hypothetical protein [Brevundimonas sp.]|jgi:hypothetical protein|uniref:hypothetical protein n=1 Tax=Brevundimonas sp. TaxID=1871086 RepID=UPI001A2F08C8|nr:hypothetical protein [Brevundimonas sp.]MBJ7509716.1 hypothetical protein [Brevundimonas sp.]
MEWERRQDGELVLSILQNFELATFTNEALAVRLEFADVQEQLRGEMALSNKQLIMTPKAAAALGKLLVEQAALANPIKGEA